MLKSEVIEILKMISKKMESNKRYWIELLLNIETFNTACDEIEKTIKTLNTYENELKFLEGLEPLGTIRVLLPCNNPIYSFVLYTCGIVLAGNSVVVRASRMTSKYVNIFYNEFYNEFKKLKITLYSGSGHDFIKDACLMDDNKGLLFTGSYVNLQDIISKYPKDKLLIYCGQGLNPFVVGKDSLMPINEIVALAIKSKIYNSGQDCLCSEKILVHSDFFDEFCNELIYQLENIKLGNFGELTADIYPPIPGLETVVNDVYELAKKDSIILFEKRNNAGALLLAVVVPLDSEIMRIEKFSPIFTISKFSNERELTKYFECEHKFGAILIGVQNKKYWDGFPHITDAKTVMDIEAEDSHAPFGGRGKSGFVLSKNYYKDGPILFSIETSKKIYKEKKYEI